MKNRIGGRLVICFAASLIACELIAQPAAGSDEMYRPQIHFTPEAHWMNDPNGMVYYKGTYHLFFQYHPYSSVWGPMHWGHAISADMVHWKQQPIAIYPDSIGTIFSGSAVVDNNNTSGFGRNGQPPLVAIFTQHNTEGEKSGAADYQTQSIAYSNDEGKTWTKYSGNPVIKNPGLKDFRDPKVMWYKPTKRWILSLSVRDHIAFYSSPDLKNWTRESDFGEGRGAHGGGWECPDLFSMDDNGKQRWVLIANLNPGGPNGGSGTQYFIGNFDGKKFTSGQKETKWIDYGPDNYAGITWSNIGNRRIFLGWMSNWAYANQVPTETWRNAMTVPRELSLRQVNNQLLVSSKPVTELAASASKPKTFSNITVSKTFTVADLSGKAALPYRINVATDVAASFSVVLSNGVGEELVAGYDKAQNRYFIDRTKSGKTNFQKDFAGRHTAPRFTAGKPLALSLLVDAGSIELFADDGITVMTSIFFPNQRYTKINVTAPGKIKIKKMNFTLLKSAAK